MVWPGQVFVAVDRGIHDPNPRAIPLAHITAPPPRSPSQPRPARTCQRQPALEHHLKLVVGAVAQQRPDLRPEQGLAKRPRQHLQVVHRPGRAYGHRHRRCAVIVCAGGRLGARAQGAEGAEARGRRGSRADAGAGAEAASQQDCAPVGVAAAAEAAGALLRPPRLLQLPPREAARVDGVGAGAWRDEGGVPVIEAYPAARAAVGGRAIRGRGAGGHLGQARLGKVFSCGARLRGGGARGRGRGSVGRDTRVARVCPSRVWSWAVGPAPRRAPPAVQTGYVTPTMLQMHRVETGIAALRTQGVPARRCHMIVAKSSAIARPPDLR